MELNSNYWKLLHVIVTGLVCKHANILHFCTSCMHSHVPTHLLLISWNHQLERSHQNIRSTSYINRPRYKNVGDNKSRRKLKLGEEPYSSSILLHTAMAKPRGSTPRQWQKSYQRQAEMVEKLLGVV